MTAVTLRTDDGISLETIVDRPDTPKGVIVLCHPHPQQGGTMRAPIIASIAKRAVAARYAAVRFNFRGVGQSTGAFGQGVGELLDVAAAVAFAETFEESVLGICGWSFGAAMALRWQALSGSGIDYVGIAPPVAGTLTPQLPEAAELSPATRKFIVGARDQFVDVEDLAAYAASIGASVDVYPSADHFFVFKHDQLAADVISALNRR